LIFYYLDASAWVKRYYQEAGTTWMQDLFAQGQMIASAPLGLIEVIATLVRKAKGREIDPPMLAQKMQELEVDWERFIRIQMTSEVVDTAKTVAKERALRGADAVHLASALLLRSRLVGEDDQLMLVASDRELKDAAQSSNLAIIDPEEQEVPASRQPEEDEQENQGGQ
jgi:predicted nucleic acid-binding protein